MSYEPSETYINGVAWPHPAKEKEWRTEVYRILAARGRHPNVVEQQYGGFGQYYDLHYRDPAGFATIVMETVDLEPAPITKPLWRLRSRAARRETVRPFIGRQVRLERWFSRVASGGDQIYEGVITAVATTTIGTSADLLILQTDEGNTWAISFAQIAHIRVKQ